MLTIKIMEENEALRDWGPQCSPLHPANKTVIAIIPPYPPPLLPSVPPCIRAFHTFYNTVILTDTASLHELTSSMSGMTAVLR